MYKKLFNSITKEEASNIFRISDGASIPKDPDNTDYQEYLSWIAEGNTPEEAE